MGNYYSPCNFAINLGCLQYEKERRYKMSYTIKDVIKAGYNLEPLICLDVNCRGEVTYHQYIKDGDCIKCGKWQKGGTE